MSNRRQSRRQSARIAVCGMLTALSVALMLAGGLIPIATYAAPIFASVLLLPIMIEYGKKTAWTAYAAVSFLSLVMGMDKEAAFFYLFLGYYPILKWDIDRCIKRRPARVLLKLAVFTLATALMYATLGFLLHMDAVVAEFREMGVLLLMLFMAALNASMLIFDRLIMVLAILYVQRIRPRLRFLR